MDAQAYQETATSHPTALVFDSSRDTYVAVGNPLLVVIVAAAAPGPASCSGTNDVALGVPLAHVVEQYVGSHVVGVAIEAVVW